MESEHCDNCNRLYNLGTREPLMMTCCGSTICKECTGNLIRPQEEEFICPFDYCKQPNRSDSKMPPNRTVKRILEKNQAVNIYCSEHLNIKADFFCKKHQTMICTNCAVQKHVDHNSSFVPLINQEFQTFCSLVQDKLKIENQRIVSMIEHFSLFLDKDRIFSSEEFIKLVQASKDAIAKQDFNQEEQKVLALLGDKIFEEAKVDNQPKADNQPNIDIPPKIDSKLIRPEDVPLITGWLGNPQKVAFELIFRGTTHGFTAAAFHKQCDNQGPTITIVKSQHGNIFGGFCHLSWQSYGKYQPDEKAFIFSITHQTKHQQYQYQQEAVGHYSNYLAIFGEDICIAGNCNQNQTSSSRFGCTYKPPEGINDDSRCQYLAGSRKFSVIEIETYKVVMN